MVSRNVEKAKAALHMNTHSQFTVVVADADRTRRYWLETHLHRAGYEIQVAEQGQHALTLIDASCPALVLLHLQLSRPDGLAVCQQVRNNHTVPIILLGSDGQARQLLKGLDLGADDYLITPFSIDELLARMHALLRRTNWSGRPSVPALSRCLHLGSLEVDTARSRVRRGGAAQSYVRRAGESISLTPTEYQLLVLLAQHPLQVISQVDLLKQVWGETAVDMFHLLHVNIHRLRQKVEPDPAHPCYIVTKRGFGYALACPLEPNNKQSDHQEASP